MKFTLKHAFLIFLLLLALSTVIFPFEKSYSISGEGAVLTLDKEKVADCNMSVEITELRSLAFRYRKTFTFTADGVTISDFEYCHDQYVTPSDLNFITQAYVSEEDGYHFYDLTYPSDLSYALLIWEDNLYFLDNGANMAYSDIPYHHVAS